MSGSFRGMVSERIDATGKISDGSLGTGRNYGRRLELFLRMVVCVAMICLTAPEVSGASCVAPPANLVDWWPAEGNASDIVGTNNGTLLNGTTFAAGEVGSAFSFDGTNDLVFIGAPAIQPPWTAEFWINRQASPEDSAVLLSDEVTALKLEQYQNTKKVGFTEWGVADYSFNYTAPIGVWTHLVFVGTTNNTQLGTTNGTLLYVNGALQDSQPVSIPLPRTTMGRDITNRYNKALKGLVDEASLYNRALSASEILALYNATSAGKCAPLAFITPPNDDFINRIPFIGTAVGNNSNATIEPYEPNPGGGVVSVTNTVWWSWTAPTNGPASVQTYGSSFDTLIDVYTGDAPSNLVCVASNLNTVLNDDLYFQNPNNGTYSPVGAGPTNRVGFSANAGTTYQIQLSGLNEGPVNIAIQPIALKVLSISQLGTNNVDKSVLFNATVEIGNSGSVAPAPLRIQVLARAGYSVSSNILVTTTGTVAANVIPGDQVLTNYYLDNPATVIPGTFTNISIAGVCPGPSYTNETILGQNANTLGFGWGVYVVLQEQFGTNWFFDDDDLLFYGQWPSVNGGVGPTSGVLRLNPSNGAITPYFQSAAINGPSTISQNSATNYYGTATFSAGPNLEYVNFTNTAWTASRFSITNGQFLAGKVTTNTPVTLTAYYSHDYYGSSITNSSQIQVMVIPTAVASLSPTALAFGPVTIGQTATQTFQMVNTGTLSLTGLVTTVSPFSISGGSPLNIGGGQTGLVQVSFSPTTTTFSSNVVVFKSNGGNSTNTITGFGVTPGQLDVSPAGLDFGVIAVGSSLQSSFVITNAGGAPITNGVAAVDGGPFAVLSGTPFSLPGFASTNLVMNFAPASAGSFSNVVVLSSDGGGSTNTLTGIGAIPPMANFIGNPAIGLVPLTVSFTDTSTGTITNRFWSFGDGATTNTSALSLSHTYINSSTNTISLTVTGPVGTNSMIQANYIVVTNVPPAQLALTPTLLSFGSLIIGQTNTQKFQVVNMGGMNLAGTVATTLPFSIASGAAFDLAPGQTGLVLVSFSPASTGNFTNAAVFVSNGGDSTNTLTGSSVTAPQLVISPTSLDFGVIALGSSFQSSFVITNAGGAPITNGVAAVDGGPFAVLSGTPFSLPGFASTNLVMNFAPASAASFSNVVVLTSDGGGSTNALTGIGAIPPVANFTGNPVSGLVPLTVSFSDDSTGTITNRFWSFGDGGTTNTSALSLSHTYTNPSTNTISLTVAGPVGTNTFTRNDYIVITNTGTVTIMIELFGNQLKLVWPVGVLQSATQPSGPYTNIPTTDSNYVVPKAPGAQFFRVQIR